MVAADCGYWYNYNNEDVERFAYLFRKRDVASSNACKEDSVRTITDCISILRSGKCAFNLNCFHDNWWWVGECSARTRGSLVAVNVALASESESSLSIIPLWGATYRRIMGPVQVLKDVYKRLARGGG